jgi:hypothetical protein
MATAEAGPGAGADLDAYLAKPLTPTEIAARRRQIREATLRESPYIREPQFSRISPRDVAAVFQQCDSVFFGRAIAAALGERPLAFRLSTRATRCAGSLRKVWEGKPAGGMPPERFELTVSTTPLFESFRDGQRSITTCGHECTDRLDALQRVVEHETVHLIEYLRWADSACSAPRFQLIARSVFGHTARHHAMMSPGDRAAALGFRPGQRVAFEFEGVRYEGVLNRVTKRATVLVPHPDGRSMRFYIPLQYLTQA